MPPANYRAEKDRKKRDGPQIYSVKEKPGNNGGPSFRGVFSQARREEKVWSPLGASSRPSKQTVGEAYSEKGRESGEGGTLRS